MCEKRCEQGKSQFFKKKKKEKIFVLNAPNQNKIEEHNFLKMVILKNAISKRWCKDSTNEPPHGKTNNLHRRKQSGNREADQHLCFLLLG